MHQIQIQETKESGWIFDKINSLRIRFYKTGELSGSSFVKIQLRPNSILKIENNDKHCFLWLILAYLHPRENSHPSIVRNYIQYFSELNINRFDFTKGFGRSDLNRFEILKNLSTNIFELNFYQDENK